MTQKFEDDFGEAARHLRVDTLVMLRWIAIIGQTIAMLDVYYYLKFDFPIGLCFVAIATSAHAEYRVARRHAAKLPPRRHRSRSSARL